MRIDSILLLLLDNMKTNKANDSDYSLLKDFISKTNFLKGKKKKLYLKINKFKNKGGVK